MKQFLKALTTAAEVYNEAITAEKLRAYRDALEDCDEEELIKALQYWIKHEEWFPKPSQLRERVWTPAHHKHFPSEEAVHRNKTAGSVPGMDREAALRLSEEFKRMMKWPTAKGNGEDPDNADKPS